MTQTEALQAALAGEHAALYGLAAAGGRLRGARFRAATTVHDEHRRRRDQLSQFLVDAGEKPVAAAVAYDLPQPVTSTATAMALVLLIERRLTAVYGDLVEAAEAAPVRSFAVQALVAAARTELRWGAGPSAFPGNA
jgi:uncharacterized protein DUF4439